MRVILLVIALIVSVFSTGCCSKTQTFSLMECTDACVADTIIIEKKVYIKQSVPPLPQRPIPTEYKTIISEINGVQYYMTDRKNSALMIGNFESYRGYTESLENILYGLQDENVTKVKVW